MTAPSSELLARVADRAIRETGFVDATLIAEAIWLAATTDGPHQDTPAASESTPPMRPFVDQEETPPSAPETVEEDDPDDPPEPTSDPVADADQDDRRFEPSIEREHDPVDRPLMVNRRTRRRRLRRLPASQGLRDPLESARAFRPFRRTVDSTRGAELDIEAMIRATVDIHHVIPVQRPRRERWHSLHIIVDASPSMELWRGYVEELAEAARHSGAFRQVTVAVEPGPVGVAPTERSIILAITDATDPSWYTESRWQSLYAYIEQAPTAILNPLPVKLWARTALGSTPARVVPRPGNPPTGRLSALPTSLSSSPHRGIPVVELDRSSIGHWAKASTTGTSTLAAVPIPALANPVPPVAIEVAPDDAIKRFRATASPAAWRLATVTSTIQATSIDVIRAIQQHLLPDSTAQDLAEFVVSGLLRPGVGGDGPIEFRQGYREALQEASEYNMDDVTAGYLAVSSGVEDQFGVSHPEFEVLVSEAEHDRPLPPGLSHFVDFAAQALTTVRANTSVPTRVPVPQPAAAVTAPSDTGVLLNGHYAPVAGVALVDSIHGQLAVTAGADGRARLWDADTGQHRTTLRGSAGSVSGVAAVALDDGVLVAIAGRDGLIQFWDGDDGIEPLGSVDDHTGPVADVAMVTAGDELFVASAGHDGSVRLWSTNEAARFIFEVGVRQFGVAAVQRSESVFVAAVGADGAIRLWDPITGTPPNVLQGHGGRVSDVALITGAGDRLLLASASHDRTARLWDGDTGQVLQVLEGHHRPVQGVALMRTENDRLFVASAGHDQTIRLWDGNTGRQLRVLEGHTEPVLSVALAGHGDELLIISGSADGTARLWLVPATPS